MNNLKTFKYKWLFWLCLTLLLLISLGVICYNTQHYFLMLLCFIVGNGVASMLGIMAAIDTK